MNEFAVGTVIRRLACVTTEQYVVTSPGIATRTFVIIQTDLGKWHLRGLFDRLESCFMLRRGDVLAHQFPYNDREVFVIMPYNDSVLVAEIIEYRNPSYWVIVRENK